MADELGSPDRKRYVLSMGPGTKLPTLGHTEYAVIRGAYTEAALGMLFGGANAILVKPARTYCSEGGGVEVAAGDDAGRVAHSGVARHRRRTTGTMLLGSEIRAALTAVEPLGVNMIGELRDGSGRDERAPAPPVPAHARIPVPVTNAGLPVLGAKGAEYPLLPDELAGRWPASSPVRALAGRWLLRLPRPISAKWLPRSRTSSVPSDRSATSRQCRRCTPQSRYQDASRFW